MNQPSDAYVDALILASRRLGRNAQAQLAQEFFQQVSSLRLDLNQSIEIWDEILKLRDELLRGEKSAPPLRRVVLDCLVRSPLLGEPVITEFSEIERLRAGAVLDSLTGLHNRRFFDDHLEREADAAVRYGQEFSLVVMDLNRFKEVNDTHGHATGDKVLVLGATALTDCARSSDGTYRIGGDEFAGLLPRTPFDGALAFAERVRKRFGEAVEPLKLGVSVSVAYGVAAAPREAKESAALFSLADERLYKFKRSIGSPRCAPRVFPRISLANTGAYSLMQWDSTTQRATVLDFSLGGVGLQLATPVTVPREFLAELHLPRLNPLATRVHKVFEIIDPNNIQRLGCAFIETAA